MLVLFHLTYSNIKCYFEYIENFDDLKLQAHNIEARPFSHVFFYVTRQTFNGDNFRLMIDYRMQSNMIYR